MGCLSIFIALFGLKAMTARYPDMYVFVPSSCPQTIPLMDPEGCWCALTGPDYLSSVLHVFSQKVNAWRAGTSL